MIDRIEITAYRLPLRRTWRTARGELDQRIGWLLRICSGTVCGFGDCAPLVEAGTESREQASAALADWRDRLLGKHLEAALACIDADDRPTPAARFAAECAILDLAARHAGLPLRRWLSSTAADRVEVNSTLGPLRDVTPRMTHACCRAGFRVMKIKVGLEAPDTELKRLANLAHRAPPEAAFRLDANGAWSLDQAARMIDGLNSLPVESLEEPLQEPSKQALRGLQATAAFPIALDESLRDQGFGTTLEDLPVHRAVLKPVVIGGLRKTRELAEQGSRIGVQVVLTSLIETAAGIWPTLQLAAAVPSSLPHGLATSGWLREDLGQSPVAARGRVSLSERPGSGFVPINAASTPRKP